MKPKITPLWLAWWTLWICYQRCMKSWKGQSLGQTTTRHRYVVPGSHFYLDISSLAQETLAHVLSNYLATPSPGYTRIFKKFLHPQDLWKKCVTDMAIQDPLRDAIEAELLSSLHWQSERLLFLLMRLTITPQLQALAFQSPPVCPEISSPSIQWEQSLVAGHPTHPVKYI